MKHFLRLWLAVFSITFALPNHAIEAGDTPYDLLGHLDGAAINISDYRGKVVIISFWATWCAPCMKELPVLSGIQKSAGQDELQVIAITHRESRPQYKRIVKAIGETPMLLLYDTHGRTAKRYKVGGIPHMVIIDRDGKVAAVNVGYSEAALPGLVDQINTIAARPVAAPAP